MYSFGLHQIVCSFVGHSFRRGIGRGNGLVSASAFLRAAHQQLQVLAEGTLSQAVNPKRHERAHRTLTGHNPPQYRVLRLRVLIFSESSPWGPTACAGATNLQVLFLIRNTRDRTYRPGNPKPYSLNPNAKASCIQLLARLKAIWRGVILDHLP